MRFKSFLFITSSLIFITFLSRCTKDNPLFSAEEGEQYSGGSTTIFDVSANAFSFQAPGIVGNDELFFFTGNSLFNQNWVSAPASTTARDGLGPMFNARTCSGCHFKDGRGKAPDYFGEFSHGLLLRLSTGPGLNGAPTPDPIYGGQLQDQSILGTLTEARFDIVYNEISGEYPDGNTYSLRNPSYQISDFAYGSLSAHQISPRVANQMIGMGLLEAIKEADILALADENDANQDGISGKVNYVWDVESQSLKMGRFGWKSNQPSVKQQVAGAFSGDLGITSSIFPDENCPPNIDCDTLPNGGTPEVTDENLDKVVLYSSVLGVPARRNWQDQDVLAGKELFNKIQCASCHIPKFTTGSHPDFTVLSNQTIRPYTDLLLHDMGNGLADGSQDYLASGKEWRTPPLWGIGLFEIVNGHTHYLHDGRARNLEEAILWHGGEAENAKNQFMDLSATERNQLILFLKSL